jgi:hypothetical protein
MPIKVNTLAFCLIRLSPAPLNMGVLYTATYVTHRTHDIQEGIDCGNEDAKSFLLSSYSIWVLPPLPPHYIATMTPPFLLCYSKCECIFAFSCCKGGAGLDQIIQQQNKCDFLPFIIPCIHAISLIQYF